jgi:hypothetical protein
MAGIDNIVNTIDNDYVQSYIDSAFEPQLPKPKLSRADKKKLKKKIRIRYITSKIDEMKKKKTFLTTWDAIIEQEPDSPEPSEPSINSEEERNNMLQEIIDTQNQMKSGYDNLDNIRRMIKQTGKNINNHMDTVGDLKVDLEFMNRRGKDFDYWLEKRDFSYMKEFKQMNKPFKKKTKSLRTFQSSNKDFGLPVSENSKLGQIMTNIKNNKGNEKLTKDDKIQIVNTLAGINGSMKEFSQDLEFRLNRAYKDHAGRKYGLSKDQIKNYTKKKAFDKGDYDAVAADAKTFLKKFRKHL